MKPHSVTRLLWLCPAMLLLGQVLLLLFLELRPGSIAIVPYFVGPKLLLVAAATCVVLVLIRALRRRSLRSSRDWVFWANLVLLSAVIVISLTAYRVYPSSHDGKPSQTCFRLPLDGDVAVIQGGPTLNVNYHAGFPAQRYAYDLGIARDGKTHRGEGYVVWDYYVYGQTVRAPADGLVIYTSDGDVDQSPSNEGWLPYKSVGGNYIVLQVRDREYLYLGPSVCDRITEPGRIFLRWIRKGEISNALRPGQSSTAGRPTRLAERS